MSRIIYPPQPEAGDGFSEIIPDGGSSPDGSTGSSLTLTSGDGSISIVGDAATNSINIEEATSSNTAEYKEFTYTDGDLSMIEVWEDSTRTVQTFTKYFTYTSGDLTELMIYDEISGVTLTKTFSYDVNGDLEYIDEVIT